MLSIPILGYLYGPVAHIPQAAWFTRWIAMPLVIFSGFLALAEATPETLAWSLAVQASLIRYAVFRVTTAATGSALSKIPAASRNGAPGK